jgi:SAM-dependent methyltransferase
MAVGVRFPAAAVSNLFQELSVLKQTFKAIGRPVWNRLRFRIGAEVDRSLSAQRTVTERLERELSAMRDQYNGDISKLRQALDESKDEVRQLQDLAASLSNSMDSRVGEILQARTFIPREPQRGPNEPFMRYSTCSVFDVQHPRYAEICREIDILPIYHRKLWEWVFIIHHLELAGVIKHGSRGVGFGIGHERLPALFAQKGCTIVATDAPPEIGIASGWSTTGQHASALNDLKYPQIVSEAIFDERVSHRFCDMNAISDDLKDFDFTWSSCCFEHLGSLEAGMQFVINSVEKTLKPGGIAVHTTEFNLSSNNDTIESGGTVIYRRRDMEELVDRLRARGHEVEPFVVAPQAHPLDFHVDIPPYLNNPHLKIRLQQYAATSVGICVRRGR